MLHTNMNCFALNPLPSKHYIKFFREQIELQVPPPTSLTTGFSTYSFFSLISLENLCSQPSVICLDFFLNSP